MDWNVVSLKWICHTLLLHYIIYNFLLRLFYQISDFSVYDLEETSRPLLFINLTMFHVYIKTAWYVWWRDITLLMSVINRKQLPCSHGHQYFILFMIASCNSHVDKNVPGRRVISLGNILVASVIFQPIQLTVLSFSSLFFFLHPLCSILTLFMFSWEICR